VTWTLHRESAVTTDPAHGLLQQPNNPGADFKQIGATAHATDWTS